MKINKTFFALLLAFTFTPQSFSSQKVMVKDCPRFNKRAEMFCAHKKPDAPELNLTKDSVLMDQRGEEREYRFVLVGGVAQTASQRSTPEDANLLKMFLKALSLK